MAKPELNAVERAPQRKKISVKNVKLSDQETGFTFSGVFRGIVQGQDFQKVNAQGEIVTSRCQMLIMENKQTGERISYLADKGLVQGLQEALVKEGALIEIVKLEKTKLSKSRTMNQYDIFALEG